jgi:cobyrinic acid a,c-diamide synthase
MFRGMSTPPDMPRLVIAAPASGQGKTTVAAAVIGLLRERGLRVAPFKAGPDYVDPTHLSLAAGRAARNLDGWLLPHETVLALFRRATAGENAADVAVVEGMMGLFDGRSATDDAGSTAEVARLLCAPVVLVIDASAAARTVAAVARGLADFDGRLRVAGVVLNRVAGEGHHGILREALLSAGLTSLGWIPDDPALAVPERDLGLVLAGERGIDIDRLLAATCATLDVDALLAAAGSAPPLTGGTARLIEPVAASSAVIAVARDEAFGFYYEDNLDLLRDAGAELRFFSPLRDERLPDDAGAVYLGGGYPELHAERLFVNLRMRRAVRDFALRGGPVYAECGGLMYISRELVDAGNRRHRMVGLVDASSRMQPRVTIGYREVVAVRDSPVAATGSELRGHEFHFSTLDRAPADAAYRRVGGTETEGTVAGPAGNVLGSYIHLHFATDPGIAPRLVQQAVRFAGGDTARCAEPAG